VPEISQIDLAALRQFAQLFVAHGLDYAKDGQKDFARDIVRFLRNGRVLPILTAAGFDCSRLQGELDWLSLACHPEDVPDFKPDLKAIRESLARIEAWISFLQPLSASDFDTPRGQGAGGGRGAPPALPCLFITTALTMQKKEHEI
jgi:hypothetical protein